MEINAGLGLHDDLLHQVVEQALVEFLQTLRPMPDKVNRLLKCVNGVVYVLIF